MDQLTDIQEGSVTAPSGRVGYTRAGSGQPLILLHGNGFSKYEFKRVLPQLATSFDVIAWDQPGHGTSAPISSDAGIADYAAALAALIDELGVKRPALVGSSIGAFIATEFASKNAERVGALILCEAQWRGPRWWRRRWELVEAMFGEPRLSREQIAGRLNVPVDDELFAQWNADRLTAGPETMLGAMRALADYDLGSALSQVHAPILLMYGKEGPTVDNAPYICGKARSATMAVLDGTGHFPAIDVPSAFVSCLNDFLSANVNEGRG